MTLKYDHLTLNMTSDIAETDTIESAVLKNPYINPAVVSLAFQEFT